MSVEQSPSAIAVAEVAAEVPRQSLPLCKFARLGQCSRPVKPTPPGSRGRKHEYCENPAHNPVTFNRARAAAARDAEISAGSVELAPVAGGGAEVALPVTAARAGFEASGSSVAATLRQLGAQIDMWLERAEAITDPENVETQIRAVTLDAAAQVTAAQQVAAAEAARRAEAERAGQAAVARAEQADADARVAQDALDAAVVQHERQLEEARAEGVRRVAEVAERALREAGDLRRALAEAGAEAERVRGEAERRERAAEQRVALVEEASAARIEAAEQKAAVQVQAAKAEAEAVKAQAAAQAIEMRRALEAVEQKTAAEATRLASELAEAREAARSTGERADQEATARREAVERATRFEAKCESLQSRFDEVSGRLEAALAEVAAEREIRAAADVEVARLRGELTARSRPDVKPDIKPDIK